MPFKMCFFIRVSVIQSVVRFFFILRGEKIQFNTGRGIKINKGRERKEVHNVLKRNSIFLPNQFSSADKEACNVAGEWRGGSLLKGKHWEKD